jgi:hypothetical protein
MTERWLPVVGYEGIYEVSDLGRVRSFLWRGPGNVRRKYARIMKPGLRKDYPVITMYRDGAIKKRNVHHLVLEAFVGPCPPGLEACHDNDVADDNRLENLRWDTRSANERDKVHNGNNHNARKTHCPQGHPYSPENTRIRPKGYRICRECVKDRREANREVLAERQREYMRRKRSRRRTTAHLNS